MESCARVLIFDDMVHVETDEDTFDPNNEWARTLQLVVRLVASRICNSIDITATNTTGTASNTHVLDMGCGTGWLPIAMHQLGANVRCTCVDVNTRSLELCRRNIASYGLENKVSILHSDLFDEIPLQTRFDYMFGCLPQLPKSLINADAAEGSHYYTNHMYQHFKYHKYGFGLLSRFLFEAHTYLKESGRIFITLSTRVDSAVIDQFIADHGYLGVRLVHYPAIQDVPIKEEEEDFKRLRYEVIGLELIPLPYTKFVESLHRNMVDYTPSSLVGELFRKCFLLRNGISLAERIAVVQPGDWPKVERALQVTRDIPSCKMTRLESNIFHGVALDVVELPPALLVTDAVINDAIENTISRSPYLSQLILTNELLFQIPAGISKRYFKTDTSSVVDLGFGANQLWLKPEQQLVVTHWYQPRMRRNEVQALLKEFCRVSFGFAPSHLTWSTSGGTISLFNEIFQHLIWTKKSRINIMMPIGSYHSLHGIVHSYSELTLVHMRTHPSNRFKWTPDVIQAHVNKHPSRCCVVYVNAPYVNPTSQYYTNDEVDCLLSMSERSGGRLIILLDAIYLHLDFNNTKEKPSWPDKGHYFIVHSLSKIFALGGLRFAFMAHNDPSFISPPEPSYSDLPSQSVAVSMYQELLKGSSSTFVNSVKTLLHENYHIMFLTMKMLKWEVMEPEGGLMFCARPRDGAMKVDLLRRAGIMVSDPATGHMYDHHRFLLSLPSMELLVVQRRVRALYKTFSSFIKLMRRNESVRQ